MTDTTQRDGLEDLTEPIGFIGDDDDFGSDATDEAKLPENRYYFRANGKEMSIPLLTFLSVRSALHFERGENVQGLLLGAESDEVREFILSLRGTAFERFMQRWEAKSKVRMGESQASSGSSASTEAPSSTTFGVQA